MPRRHRTIPKKRLLFQRKYRLNESKYATTVAVNKEFQSNQEFDFRNPEVESEIKGFKELLRELKKHVQSKKKLQKLLQRRYTYEDLKEAIHKIIMKIDPDCAAQRITEWFIQTAEKRFSLFRNIPVEIAKACALALSFWTGPVKDSREDIGEWNNHSLGILRFLNALSDSARASKDSSVFVYFMLKALNNLPRYSGVCTKALHLSPKMEALYKVGGILAMKCFNSSSKSENPPKFFEKENARFIFFSKTGRNIAAFSNASDENEVLIAPGSTFLVVKKEIKNGITYIYLREVELGSTEKTIVLVDEKLDDENWELKKDADEFSSQEYLHNISIVRKSSKTQAMAYLESPFGQESLMDNRRIVVITIPRNSLKSNIIFGAGAFEKSCKKLFRRNRNFNPPYTWHSRGEALENLFKEEEIECLDQNLQIKEAKLEAYNRDLDSNDTLFSTTQTQENFKIFDSFNIDNFSSKSSMDWNLNSGIQLDNSMNYESASWRMGANADEESSRLI